MSGQQQNPNAEIVGMGAKSLEPIKAPSGRVWAAMVDKMYNTEKYLPVTNVKTIDKIPGRHVYREMLIDGEPYNQNIYFDESRYEIRADVDGEDEIHVNIYYPETGFLEYWRENRKGERISWDVPKAVVLRAMEQTKQVAEANE